MYYFIVLVLLVSVLELIYMKKRKEKKEIVVYLLFATMTLALGIFYLSNPYRNSLVYFMLKMLGLKD